MPDIPSDDGLQALIEQWRTYRQTVKQQQSEGFYRGLRHCADALEAALRVSPPSSQRQEQKGDQARMDTNADSSDSRTAAANEAMLAAFREGYSEGFGRNSKYEPDDAWERSRTKVAAGVPSPNSQVTSQDVLDVLRGFVNADREHQSYDGFSDACRPLIEQAEAILAHARTPEDQ